MSTTTLALRLAAAALAGALGLSVGGVGVAAAATSAGSSDEVNLHVMVQPAATAAGASFTDAITVENVGQGGATDVTLSVPFDSSQVQLLGVQFNQPGAWVTSVAPNAFHADLGEIGSQGKSVQMTASFAELPGYTASSALPVSIAYHYRSNGESHSGSVNSQLLPIEMTTTAPQQVSTSMVVTAGSAVPVNSAIFAPGEAVALWYNTPDGQTLPLYLRSGRITTEHQRKELMANGTTHYVNNGAYLYADSQGAIAAPFSTSGLQPGAYTLVAHGLTSSATAVVAFQVQ